MCKSRRYMAKDLSATEDITSNDAEGESKEESDEEVGEDGN